MNNHRLLPALISFSEVAKSGSFTKAANKLNLSKAAVSIHIKKLEEQVGQPLMSRNTRGMALTVAGRSLLERTEFLQDQVRDIFDTLESTKSEPKGSLTITLPHSCEKQIVLPAVIQLSKEYPGLCPELIVTDESLDLISNNIDVAIHGGELKDSSYRALLVGRAREVFCSCPSTFASRFVHMPFEKILDEPFVAAPWQKNYLQVRQTNESGFSVERVNFRARANTLPSTIALTKAGLGIALLPEFSIWKSLISGELIRVLPEHQGREWPFYFVHRYSGEKPEYISRLYELVAHFFRQASRPPA